MLKCPVSDELRESIISALKKRQKVVGKEKGVLDIKAGNKPGEIIYVAVEMNISCIVSEDDVFFWFDWEYGKKQRARKEDFLSELSQKLSTQTP